MVKLLSATTGSSFDSWGWRVPFLASLVLVVIGLYVRLRVTDSPAFRQVQQTRRGRAAAGAGRSCSDQPREVLTAAFVRMSEQAPFYLFVTFVLTYGTDQLGLAKGDAAG